MAIDPEIGISNMNNILIVVSCLSMVQNIIISVTITELGESILLLTFDWVKTSVTRFMYFAVSRNVTFHVSKYFTLVCTVPFLF
jgi:hypothetical protein